MSRWASTRSEGLSGRSGPADQPRRGKSQWTAREQEPARAPTRGDLLTRYVARRDQEKIRMIIPKLCRRALSGTRQDHPRRSAPRTGSRLEGREPQLRGIAIAGTVDQPE